MLEYVPIVITDEMNSSLSRAFEASEVNVALQEMAPLKAHGPDGMPPILPTFLRHGKP